MAMNLSAGATGTKATASLTHAAGQVPPSCRGYIPVNPFPPSCCDCKWTLTVRLWTRDLIVRSPSRRRAACASTAWRTWTKPCSSSRSSGCTWRTWGHMTSSTATTDSRSDSFGPSSSASRCAEYYKCVKYYLFCYFITFFHPIWYNTVFIYIYIFIYLFI